MRGGTSLAGAPMLGFSQQRLWNGERWTPLSTGPVAHAESAAPPPRRRRVLRRAGAAISLLLALALVFVASGILLRHDPAAWLPGDFPLNAQLRTWAAAAGLPTPLPVTSTPTQRQLDAWHDRVATVTFGFVTQHWGSAFALDATRLVTAAHVVTGRTAVSVRDVAVAGVAAVDQEHDLAMLRLAGSAALPRADGFHLATYRPWAGQPVWGLCAYGAQGVVPMTVIDPSGQVLEQDGASTAVNISDGLILSGVAHPGCSGGPVVDGDGSVVGVMVTEAGAISAGDVAAWASAQGVPFG